MAFLIRRDVRRRFRSAPLTGTTAAGLLPAALRERMDTVVLWRDGETLVRSAAVIGALGALGGGWVGLRALLVVPRPLRDAAYDWVARHRSRWFGCRATCLASTIPGQEVFLP